MVHRSGMPLKAVHGPAVCVPHLDRSAGVSADQSFALGVVGYAPDGVLVPLEREFLPTGRDVPDAEEGRIFAGRQALAVGAEVRTISPAGMPGERSEQPPGACLEEMDVVAVR